MLHKFTFENVFSFKDEQELNLIATSKQERLFDDKENYHTDPEGNKVLRSAVVYGANAGGKSNLAKAFNAFKILILTGSQNFEQVGYYDMDVPSFQLNTESANSACEFELECTLEGKWYRYGFRLAKTGLEEEWLYTKEKKEIKIFYRKGQDFSINNKNKILKELVAKNMVHSKAFLVTVGGQFNDSVCSHFLSWIFYQINIISGNDEENYRKFTFSKLMKDNDFRKKVVSLLKKADFGILDISLNKNIPQFINGPKRERDTVSVNEILSHRLVMDENGVTSVRDFSFSEFESEGTKKLAYIAGPIFDTLERGCVLIIDELDSKLHPELTERIILMFHNNEINKNNAQLIFTTHNTNLLSSKIFRRDQIIFVEKDSFGQSELYPLSSFKSNGKSTRNDENYEINYLKGKYGAIPFLGDFDNYLNR